MTTNPAHGELDLSWTFGDKLRKVRKARGDSQRDFAALMGVKFSTLGAWEVSPRDPRGVVEIAKRVQMVTGGQVRADWMLGLTQNPRPDQGPDGDDGVRREGIEPPTRCFGAVDADVIAFPGGWYGLEEAAA